MYIEVGLKLIIYKCKRRLKKFLDKKISMCIHIGQIESNSSPRAGCAPIKLIEQTHNTKRANFCQYQNPCKSLSFKCDFLQLLSASLPIHTSHRFQFISSTCPKMGRKSGWPGGRGLRLWMQSLFAHRSESSFLSFTSSLTAGRRALEAVQTIAFSFGKAIPGGRLINF